MFVADHPAFLDPISDNIKPDLLSGIDQSVYRLRRAKRCCSGDISFNINASSNGSESGTENKGLTSVTIEDVSSIDIIQEPTELGPGSDTPIARDSVEENLPCLNVASNRKTVMDSAKKSCIKICDLAIEGQERGNIDFKSKKTVTFQAKKLETTNARARTEFFPDNVQVDGIVQY